MNYATINKSGKFTGVVYLELTENVKAWHEENGYTWLPVLESKLPNLGTEENPDYGAPTQAQLDAAVYTCSPWQIRKALNQQGLRQTVEDAVAASTDDDLKDGWKYASVFKSDDPFVISMGQTIGKNESEVAELIQLAATL